MAKKSKGFGELLREKRSEQIHAESLEMFDKKIKNSDWGQKLVGTFIRPKGQKKMSEVLQDFVEPYTEFAESYEAQQRLFTTAIVAWNLALLTEQKRKETLDEFLKQGAMGKRKQEKQDAEEIITEMIERKLKVFAKYDCFITDFQLRDLGDSYHLSVASVDKHPVDGI
jgi:hypothetical protein